MGIEPEGDEWRGIGIGQADFAEDLEGGGGDLRRIGDDAGNDFQAVNVGGMLLGAAEPVGDGHGEKREHLQQQKKDGEGSPVVGAVYFPDFAPAVQRPMEAAIADIQRDEEHGGKKEKAASDMVEYVVAGF